MDYPVKSKAGTFSDGSSSNLYPIIRLNFNKKVFLRSCHMVALTVNLISRTRISDDVMNGVELDDVKLRYIEIICIKGRL